MTDPLMPTREEVREMLAPLGSFEADPANPSRIFGEWWEDLSRYEITVPHQLRDTFMFLLNKAMPAYLAMLDKPQPQQPAPDIMHEPMDAPVRLREAQEKHEREQAEKALPALVEQFAKDHPELVQPQQPAPDVAEAMPACSECDNRMNLVLGEHDTRNDPGTPDYWKCALCGNRRQARARDILPLIAAKDREIAETERMLRHAANEAIRFGRERDAATNRAEEAEALIARAKQTVTEHTAEEGFIQVGLRLIELEAQVRRLWDAGEAVSQAWDNPNEESALPREPRVLPAIIGLRSALAAVPAAEGDGELIGTHEIDTKTGEILPAPPAATATTEEVKP